MAAVATLVIGTMTTLVIFIVFGMLHEVVAVKEREGWGTLILVATIIIPYSLSERLVAPKSFEDNTWWGVLLGYVLLIVFAYFYNYRKRSKAERSINVPGEDKC